MNDKRLLLILSLILSIGLQVKPAMSATPLGLFVTQEELNIWRQRAATGPYKTKGDVSPNSPGDWNRIQKNATDFILDPSSERWDGQTTNSCFVQRVHTPSRKKGVNVRDAAFYYLVTGNSSYRDAVKQALLAQAAVTGTHFENRTRWCIKDHSNLDVAAWIGRLLFAYDYIRNDISDGDRAKLDFWFLNAANWLEANVHGKAAKRWPNRKSDSYGASSMALGPAFANIYYGAPVFYQWHLAWGNITAVETRTFGLIGVMLNNTKLKNESKRWFKEAMRYIVWYKNTDNIATHGEYMRCCLTSHSNFPTLGFGYVSSSLLSMTMLADALSRAGDNELYTYTTSEGYYTTEGGPKNLKAVIKTHLQMMQHAIVRYGTSSAADLGTSSFIIDNVYEPTKWHHVGDAWVAPLANRFYKDSFFKAAYQRKAPGMPSYPSSPASSAVDAWMGDLGTFPGVLFMFGDMEGGSTSPVTLLNEPTDLKLEVK
jgi:hypothetical protein